MEFRIRPAEPEDYTGIQQIYSQPRTVFGTLQLSFTSAAEWKKRIADIPNDNALLVAESGDTLAGSIFLKIENNIRRRHVAHIGMGVHDDWQRQGVGSLLLSAALDLADNWFDIRRIELTVFKDNEAAIALYSKFDFEVEGVLRQYAFRNGQYADVLAMARLKLSSHDCH